VRDEKCVRHSASSLLISPYSFNGPRASAKNRKNVPKIYRCFYPLLNDISGIIREGQAGNTFSPNSLFPLYIICSMAI
jgi:hypothetical protein